MDVSAVIGSCTLVEARFLLDHFMSMAINKVIDPDSPQKFFIICRIIFLNFLTYPCIYLYLVVLYVSLPSSGSAGGSEGVAGEGDGGQAETDGDHQRHPEPAALPHAEGKGGVQPRAGRSAGKRSPR